MSEVIGRLSRTIEARGPNPLWVESRDALVAAYDTIAALHERIGSLEARGAAPEEPVVVEQVFARWRDREIDSTGTLPEGFEMFRAGWRQAVAGVKGEHDHIEDGANYLDCAACAFSTAGQAGLEALLGVLMSLPVDVRRDTTELARHLLRACPALGSVPSNNNNKEETK